jgi:hypothetical protein
MEVIKSLVVFVHLIACCVALGLVLYLDMSLLFSRRRELSPKLLQDMQTLPTLVHHGLVALWATGFAIVAIGMQMKGLAYLDNPKLWVKVLVVTVLSINGWLLHRYALPMMVKSLRLSDLARKQRLHLCWMAGISGASWMTAAYLGIARYMNGSLSFTSILAVYLLVLLASLALTLYFLVFDLEKRRQLAPHTKAITPQLF